MTWRLVLLAIVVASATAACGGPDDVDSVDPEPASEGPVRFEVVASGPQGPPETAEVVAPEATDLAQAWRVHGGEEIPGIEVDEGRALVAVFAGTRPTAGYGVEITEVTVDGVVRYQITEPGQGCMTAQVITAPFVVASVPEALVGTVTFEGTTRTVDC